MIGLTGLVGAAMASLPTLRAQAAPSTTSVVAFGDNASGELGTGTLVNSATAVQVKGLAGAKAIAAGGLHSLALMPDGTVMAWGANFAGQLGDGTTTDRPVPVRVAGLTGVVAVAVGDVQSLALLSNGTVMAWGADNFGQLGDGTTHDRAVPGPVKGLAGVVGIAAGSAHNLAVTGAGTVMAWGDDSLGQLGDSHTNRDPNGVPRPVVVPVTPPTTPPTFTPLTGVKAVSAGLVSSFALRTDGTVLAWGSGGFGALGVAGGSGVRTTPVPVKIQLGPAPTGRLGDCTPVTCVPLTKVTAISSSQGSPRQSLALRSDGSVVAWGGNFEGQLGVNVITGLNASNRALPVFGLDGVKTKVVAIAAGGGHSLALTSTGTVLAWGEGHTGQLGNGKLGVREFAKAPVAVTGLTDVTAIAAGGAHSVALKGGPGAQAPPGPAATALRTPVPAEATEASDQKSPANVDVTPAAAGVNATFAPVVAADPTHPGHLAIAYGDDSPNGSPPGKVPDRCWLALSADGGKTWTSRVLIGAGGDFSKLPPSASDPTTPFDACATTIGSARSFGVAYGPDGTLYYSTTLTEGAVFGAGTPNEFDCPNCGSNGRVFLTASTDGGRTFSPLTKVDAGARPPNFDPRLGGDQDYMGDITVDQATGDVYVGWVEFSQLNTPYNGIKVARCRRAAGVLGCGTATQAAPAVSLDPQLNMQLAVGAGGRVYLGWIDETEVFNVDGNNPTFNPGDIGPVAAKVAFSIDGGATFSSPTVADRVYRVCPAGICPTGFDSSPTDSGSPSFYDLSIATRPASAGSGDGERGDDGIAPVFVAMAGARFGSDGRNRLALSTSTDGGRTFGAAHGVGVVAGQESHDQHDPGLAVSKDGTLSLAWYDQLDGAQDVYLASGDELDKPVKLTTVSSDKSVLQGYTGQDDLTRISVVAGDEGASVAWLDSRLGTPATGRTDSFFATTVRTEGGDQAGAGSRGVSDTPTVGAHDPGSRSTKQVHDTEDHGVE